MGERGSCVLLLMLLGQANVVRHCALAKACFALAFDSQVQCRECPLNVGPPPPLLAAAVVVAVLLLHLMYIFTIYL